MSDCECSTLPDGFTAEIRDALAHLYDYAYLARHPLVQRLAGASQDATVAIQKLRRLLIEAVEALRPPADTPPDDPSWRPHAVLQHRYVLGKDLADVERDLGLGKRQIQREQHRAMDALAVVVWSRHVEPIQSPPSRQSNDPLWQEISRLAAQQQTFEAGEQLERALQSVRALAQTQGVELDKHRATLPTQVLGDPSLCRQLLVAALSSGIRLVAAGRLSISLERHATGVIYTLLATVTAAAEVPALPDAVFALARAQNANITQDVTADRWRLQIKLQAAGHDRVIAMVEDNEDVVALFSRYLATQGYKLVGISDSTQAVERVTELMPMAVVLDVMMRDVDGWEVLQQLKADLRLCHIPVVVCSVLDEFELAASLGADAYLRKPTRPAELLECLVRLTT